MNYKFLAKYGQSLAFGTGALLIVLFFLIVLISGQDTALNFIIWSGLGLLVVTLIVLFGYSIYHVLIDPKGSAKGLIGMGAMLVLFLILYFTSTPETTGKLGTLHETFSISDNLSRVISGGIKSTLILAALGIGAFLYSEVRNLFK